MDDFLRKTSAIRKSGLSEYQRQARKQPSRWLLRIMVAIAVTMIVRGYMDKPDPEELTWSALRIVDTDLSAASYASDWPAWAFWLSGMESEEETLDWVSKELTRLDEEEFLTAEGEEALQWISALAGDRPDEMPIVDWERKFREGVYAWERLAARRQFEDDPPEWWLTEESYYQDWDRERAYVAAVGSAFWWLMFLVGIPFVPAALRCFRVQNHKSLSSATRAWQPNAVTVRYICVDILAGWFIAALYLVIPEVLWTYGYMPTLIASDALWRLAGPFLLGALLFVRWRHAPRLLGLDRKPIFPPILGMMSLGFLFDWGVGFLVSLFTRSEDLDGLSYIEEGPWGLLFVVISGVILAPLVEEILYRGILFQSYLRRFGFGIAMLLSTLFFVFIHFYGVYGSLSVGFFGICACALYRATGSLWTAIAFHALYNGLIFGTMWPLYHGF